MQAQQSNVVYEPIPNGVYAKLKGSLGSIEATVHCKFSSMNPFRICFATCTGHALALQGKVRDFPSLEAVKTELERYERVFNGAVTEVESNAELRFHILDEKHNIH